MRHIIACALLVSACATSAAPIDPRDAGPAVDSGVDGGDQQPQCARAGDEPSCPDGYGAGCPGAHWQRVTPDPSVPCYLVGGMVTLPICSSAGGPVPTCPGDDAGAAGVVECVPFPPSCAAR